LLYKNLYCSYNKRPYKYFPLSNCFFFFFFWLCLMSIFFLEDINTRVVFYGIKVTNIGHFQSRQVPLRDQPDCMNQVVEKVERAGWKNQITWEKSWCGSSINHPPLKEKGYQWRVLLSWAWFGEKSPCFQRLSSFLQDLRGVVCWIPHTWPTK